MGLTAGYRYDGDTWQFQLTGTAFGSAHTGDMIDSDWLDPTQPNRLAYYSRSDTQLNSALMTDILLLQRIKNTRFSIGIGYQVTEWALNITNVRQDNYISGDRYVSPPFQTRYAGVAMTYDARHTMIYTAVQYDQVIAPYAITAMLGYAGNARMIDTDDHLLRGKRMQAEATGPALRYRLMLSRAIGSLSHAVRAFIEIAGQSSDLAGVQTQVFYTDPTQDPIMIQYQSRLALSVITVGITATY